jgi:adenylate cyclase
MSETRKITAILAADVAGFSRMTSADEDRTLARLRALRSELIDPIVASQNGRVFKRTGDGALIEFRSVVEAVRCAITIQSAMIERNSGMAADQRIDFRIGIHLGDVVEESDGDLMGDGVNIAARLEALAKPGGICLSEQAYWQVKARLDLAVIDLGETKLKNIAEPIRAYSLQVGAPAEPKAAAKPAPSEKPSIAALAFQNMSGDPEQEYFADGMVEDIITGLSRIKSLLVIARNSSFVYKGKAVDIRQVGRELGARYILEGSVRKGGNRLRINAQLIEAETGAHLWADRFEGGLDDIFELQDQVTERVVGVVEPSLRQAEIERSRRTRPENLEAYDHYLRALPHMTSQMPADAKVALGFLGDALRLDPDYAAAHAFSGWCHEIGFMRGGFDEADKTAGLRHARAAIACGTDDATALAVAGFVIWNLAHEHETALRAIERALFVNPSCAMALYFGGYMNVARGNCATGTAYARRALRASPFDPISFFGQLTLGAAALFETRYDEAVPFYAKAVQANPGFSTLYAGHAIALALAGRGEEARPVVRQLLELEPGFRAGMIRQFGLIPSLAEKWLEGARLAGLPE